MDGFYTGLRTFMVWNTDIYGFVDVVGVIDAGRLWFNSYNFEDFNICSIKTRGC